MRIPSTLRLAAVITAPLLLAPQIAAACAVCFSGRADETRIAFLLTTILLTFLPIFLIGSVVWWLRKRAQQIRDEHESHATANADR